MILAAASLVLHAAVAASAPTPPPLSYQDGFLLQTPDGVNRLKLHGLVQPRLSLVASDADVADWTSSFAVQRAQIELVGSVFSPRFRFELKLELGQGQAFAKDAYLDGVLVDGALVVRAGVFKRPFGREQLTPAWRLAFLERSITDAAFFAGHDVGVELTDAGKRAVPLEYALGVFAGTSNKPKVSGDVVDGGAKGAQLQGVKISNVPKLMKPTFVARLGYDFGHIDGYSQFDFDGGPLRFAVAGSVVEVLDPTAAAGDATRAEIDAIAKVAGVTVSAAVFSSGAQTDPRSLSQSWDASGGYAEAGVLLFGTVQPSARYAVVVHRGGPVEHEVLANATVLFAGLNVAWAAEVGTLVTDGAPSLVARTQAQLRF